MKTDYIAIQFIKVTLDNQIKITLRADMLESTRTTWLYIDSKVVSTPFQTPEDAYEAIYPQLIRWGYQIDTVRVKELAIETASNIMFTDQVKAALIKGGLGVETLTIKIT